MTCDWPVLARQILRVMRLPDDAAQAGPAETTADLAGQPVFAWARSTEPRRPHCYQTQGPRTLAEYDNTWRDANQVRTVWRDPHGDFGPRHPRRPLRRSR